MRIYYKQTVPILSHYTLCRGIGKGNSPMSKKPKLAGQTVHEKLKHLSMLMQWQQQVVADLMADTANHTRSRRAPSKSPAKPGIRQPRRPK